MSTYNVYFHRCEKKTTKRTMLSGCKKSFIWSHDFHFNCKCKKMLLNFIMFFIILCNLKVWVTELTPHNAMYVYMQSGLGLCCWFFKV